MSCDPLACSIEMYKNYMCGRDKVIISGTRRIQTNLWGVPTNEVVDFEKNCVFVDESDKYGWKWDRPDPKPSPGQQDPWPIYPDVTTGTTPWGGYNTNPSLPVKISDIKTLVFRVEYEYTAMPSPSDGLNFAYDAWIIDKAKPDAETLRTKRELMIWINKQNVGMPAGPSVSDGMNTYTLATWEGYNAFMLEVVPPSGVATHEVNVKKLLDYLVQQNLIPANWYLAEIAIGNEVWKSKGAMLLTKIELNLNGQVI